MPLPFTFSTHRLESEGETPAGAVEAPRVEEVVRAAAGHINSSPMFGTPGNSFSPPMLDVASSTSYDPSRRAYEHRPITASIVQSMRGAGESDPAIKSPTETLRFATNPSHATDKVTSPVGMDWMAQIDQMRNDVFGIAMSVSALSDRIDRLELRLPSNDQAGQEGMTKLRREIEVWLENHLTTAVEYCMSRIASRTATPATQSYSQPVQAHS